MNLDEILKRFGTATTIMTFLGDYFDAFIILNSLNRRVRERLKANKNGLINIFSNEKRRRLKIWNFDQDWKDFLLKSQIYKVLELDIDISPKTLICFLEFLKEWDWNGRIFFKKVFLRLNDFQKGESQVLKYLWNNKISLDLWVWERKSSNHFITLWNKKCWILSLSQLKNTDENINNFREIPEIIETLFSRVKHLNYWNFKDFKKQTDEWREQNYNKETQKNCKVLDYARAHGIEDLMERTKVNWEINLWKEKMLEFPEGQKKEIKSYRTRNSIKDTRVPYKKRDFYFGSVGSCFAANYPRDFDIKIENAKIYYFHWEEVKSWQAQNIYLMKDWIIKDSPSLQMMEEDPHLLSVSLQITNQYEILDWKLRKSIGYYMEDKIKNTPNCDKDYLFIEVEGISWLNWDHDLLKLLLNRTWFPNLKSSCLKINLCESQVETLEWFRIGNPSNQYIFEVKAIVSLSESNEYEKIIEFLIRVINLKPNKLSIIFEDTKEFKMKSKLEPIEMDNIFKVMNCVKNTMDLSILVRNKNSEKVDYSLHLSSYSIPILLKDLLEFRENIAHDNLGPAKYENLEMEIFENPKRF